MCIYVYSRFSTCETLPPTVEVLKSLDTISIVYNLLLNNNLLIPVVNLDFAGNPSFTSVVAIIFGMDILRILSSG